MSGTEGRQDDSSHKSLENSDSSIINNYTMSGLEEGGERAESSNPSNDRVSETRDEGEVSPTTIQRNSSSGTGGQQGDQPENSTPDNNAGTSRGDAIESAEGLTPGGDVNQGGGPESAAPGNNTGEQDGSTPADEMSGLDAEEETPSSSSSTTETRGHQGERPERLTAGSNADGPEEQVELAETSPSSENARDQGQRTEAVILDSKSDSDITPLSPVPGSTEEEQESQSTLAEATHLSKTVDRMGGGSPESAIPADDSELMPPPPRPMPAIGEQQNQATPPGQTAGLGVLAVAPTPESFSKTKDDFTPIADSGPSSGPPSSRHIDGMGRGRAPTRAGSQGTPTPVPRPSTLRTQLSAESLHAGGSSAPSTVSPTLQGQSAEAGGNQGSQSPTPTTLGAVHPTPPIVAPASASSIESDDAPASSPQGQIANDRDYFPPLASKRRTPSEPSAGRGDRSGTPSEQPLNSPVIEEVKESGWGSVFNDLLGRSRSNTASPASLAAPTSNPQNAAPTSTPEDGTPTSVLPITTSRKSFSVLDVFGFRRNTPTAPDSSPTTTGHPADDVPPPTAQPGFDCMTAEKSFAEEGTEGQTGDYTGHQETPLLHRREQSASVESLNEGGETSTAAAKAGFLRTSSQAESTSTFREPLEMAKSFLDVLERISFETCYENNELLDEARKRVIMEEPRLENENPDEVANKVLSEIVELLRKDISNCLTADGKRFSDAQLGEEQVLLESGKGQKIHLSRHMQDEMIRLIDKHARPWQEAFWLITDQYKQYVMDVATDLETLIRRPPLVQTPEEEAGFERLDPEMLSKKGKQDLINLLLKRDTEWRIRTQELRENTCRLADENEDLVLEIGNMQEANEQLKRIATQVSVRDSMDGINMPPGKASSGRLTKKQGIDTQVVDSAKRRYDRRRKARSVTKASAHQRGTSSLPEEPEDDHGSSSEEEKEQEGDRLQDLGDLAKIMKLVFEYRTQTQRYIDGLSISHEDIYWQTDTVPETADKRSRVGTNYDHYTVEELIRRTRLRTVEANDARNELERLAKEKDELEKRMKEKEKLSPPAPLDRRLLDTAMFSISKIVNLLTSCAEANAISADVLRKRAETDKGLESLIDNWDHLVNTQQILRSRQLNLPLDEEITAMDDAAREAWLKDVKTYTGEFAAIINAINRLLRSDSREWPDTRQPRKRPEAEGAWPGAPGQAGDGVSIEPLFPLPQWLATHPHGRCGDCVPVMDFPPTLDEGHIRGCNCGSDDLVEDGIEKKDEGTKSRTRGVTFDENTPIDAPSRTRTVASDVADESSMKSAAELDTPPPLHTPYPRVTHEEGEEEESEEDEGEEEDGKRGRRLYGMTKSSVPPSSSSDMNSDGSSDEDAAQTPEPAEGRKPMAGLISGELAERRRKSRPAPRPGHQCNCNCRCHRSGIQVVYYTCRKMGGQRCNEQAPEESQVAIEPEAADVVPTGLWDGTRAVIEQIASLLGRRSRSGSEAAASTAQSQASTRAPSRAPSAEAPTRSSPDQRARAGSSRALSQTPSSKSSPQTPPDNPVTTESAAGRRRRALTQPTPREGLKVAITFISEAIEPSAVNHAPGDDPFGDYPLAAPELAQAQDPKSRDGQAVEGQAGDGKPGDGEPVTDGPASEDAPTLVPVPRPWYYYDLVGRILGSLWHIFKFSPLGQVLNIYKIVLFVLSAILYLPRSFLLERPQRPIPPWSEAKSLFTFTMIMWYWMMIFVLDEERRIWVASNSRTAAYLRGMWHRDPYPWWWPFRVDYALLEPALDRVVESLHEYYFRFEDVAMGGNFSAEVLM